MTETLEQRAKRLADEHPEGYELVRRIHERKAASESYKNYRLDRFSHWLYRILMGGKRG